MRFLRRDGHTDMSKVSDLPWFGSHVLILRPRAMDALAPILRRHGELLPLTSDDGELWLFNCTTVLDALDEERSIVQRLPGAEKIIWIVEPVLRAAEIRGVDVFKLRQYSLGAVFVSDSLVQATNAAGLRGVEFELVWASDHKPKGPRGFLSHI